MVWLYQLRRVGKEVKNVTNKDLDRNENINKFHRLNPLVSDITRHIKRSDTVFVQNCEKVIQALIG